MARALPDLPPDDPWYRRLVAWQESQVRHLDPPSCYGYEGPCYCDRMPPDQLCCVCIGNAVPLPPPPCRRGVWPHDWEAYATGPIYGRDKDAVRTLRKACRRCHANEVLPGEPFTFRERPLWWLPFRLAGIPVRR